jgi:hypothetical protein
MDNFPSYTKCTVTESFKHGHEPSESRKVWEFLDKLREYWLFNKFSVSWSSLLNSLNVLVLKKETYETHTHTHIYIFIYVAHME